jgi:hypothetical protein
MSLTNLHPEESNPAKAEPESITHTEISMRITAVRPFKEVPREILGNENHCHMASDYIRAASANQGAH